MNEKHKIYLEKNDSLSKEYFTLLNQDISQKPTIDTFFELISEYSKEVVENLQLKLSTFQSPNIISKILIMYHDLITYNISGNIVTLDKKSEELFPKYLRNLKYYKHIKLPEPNEKYLRHIIALRLELIVKLLEVRIPLNSSFKIFN